MRPFALEQPLPIAVGAFLEIVAPWPATRWRHALAAKARCAADRRATSALVRDAIMSREELQLDAWFAADAARTVGQLLPTELTPIERQAVFTLVADAALALLARPWLPRLDLAVLLAPFLPLHLDDAESPC